MPTNLEVDMSVRHVGGGCGVIVRLRRLIQSVTEDQGPQEALVEWDDESRTWESVGELEALQ